MIGQWLLLILYLLIGAANVIRAAQAWVFNPVLTETSLPLPVLGGVYLLLGFLFIVAGVLYFRRTDRRTRWLARGLALGYQIIVWLIDLVGDRAAYTRRLWGRDLILTLFFLSFVVLITTKTARSRR